MSRRATVIGCFEDFDVKSVQLILSMEAVSEVKVIRTCFFGIGVVLEYLFYLPAIALDTLLPA